MRDRSYVASRGAAALLLVVALLVVTGVGAVVARRAGSIAHDAESAEVQPGRGSGAASSAAPVGSPLRVRIKAIGVLAPLLPLRVRADGTLEVPPYEAAGWYAGGSRPGDRGPAVIAAHVDSTTGPAVFYRLKELKPGDAVHVDYGDGTVTFSVRGSQSFPKSQFPTREVYGPTDGPELRLITCDGAFDRQTRSYRSNLVVWADLASPLAAQR